jgi:hypothetical protein
MNYRRGFQRLYAVFAVAWIAISLFALPAYRLRFWVVPIDDSYAARVRESKALGTLPQGYILDHTFEWTKQQRDQKEAMDALLKKYGTIQPPARDWFKENAPPSSSPSDWQNVEPTRDSFIPDEPGFTESRIGKSLWLLSLLFGPPVIGYAAIFLMIPWVYRGFRKTGGQV